MPAVKPWSVALSCAVALRCLLGAWSAQAGNADFVDPFIGTAAGAQPYAKGNTFPGATGAQRHGGRSAPIPARATRAVTAPGAASSRGSARTTCRGSAAAGDLGNILLMPTVGAVEDAPRRPTAPRYSDEAAEPGYYKVSLTKGGISAEMSATTRATISRYTFPAARRRRQHPGRRQPRPDAEPRRLVRIVSATEVEGYNDTGGFLRQRSPPTGSTSSPGSARPPSAPTAPGGVRPSARRPPASGSDVGAYFRFDTAAGEASRGPARALLCQHRRTRGPISTRKFPPRRTFDQVRADALAQVEQRPRPGRRHRRHTAAAAHLLHGALPRAAPSQRQQRRQRPVSGHERRRRADRPSATRTITCSPCGTLTAACILC